MSNFIRFRIFSIRPSSNIYKSHEEAGFIFLIAADGDSHIEFNTRDFSGLTSISP